MGRENLVHVTPWRVSLCTGGNDPSKGNLTYNPAPLLVFYLVKVMSMNLQNTNNVFCDYWCSYSADRLDTDNGVLIAHSNIWDF